MKHKTIILSIILSLLTGCAQSDPVSTDDVVYTTDTTESKAEAVKVKDAFDGSDLISFVNMPMPGGYEIYFYQTTTVDMIEDESVLLTLKSYNGNTDLYSVDVFDIAGTYVYTSGDEEYTDALIKVDTPFDKKLEAYYEEKDIYPSYMDYELNLDLANYITLEDLLIDIEDDTMLIEIVSIKDSETGEYLGGAYANDFGYRIGTRYGDSYLKKIFESNIGPLDDASRLEDATEGIVRSYNFRYDSYLDWNIKIALVLYDDCTIVDVSADTVKYDSDFEYEEYDEVLVSEYPRIRTSWNHGFIGAEFHTAYKSDVVLID